MLRGSLEVKRQLDVRSAAMLWSRCDPAEVLGVPFHGLEEVNPTGHNGALVVLGVVLLQNGDVAVQDLCGMGASE